ncbi:Ecotropic viral integration site 5 protein-like [Hondaea fermentalgiana]|uniref:Ecotropic viral integration site 5 protein-like n=1 Tax=Hondaea fermentalgiana TaxID=2315210 RepID=A0A2R5G6G6_9STRA|nr:Ecotropic viral integration site 5 protein-like [Hondaea fermentalgiana]|eukprot:GBG26590.1 Ecotropic viral integration site 5 protein-like [Hondaea fermentalgiana]
MYKRSSLRSNFSVDTINSDDASDVYDEWARSQSSSINDAFGAQVTNPACGYGHLRFANGAIFQGTVCNHVEAMTDGIAIAVQASGQDIEQRPATFLTSSEECVHGTWVFIRLQYDLDTMSPLAVYNLDASVLTEDGAVHPYRGPAHLLLKYGILVLPIARNVLKSQRRFRERSRSFSSASSPASSAPTSPSSATGSVTSFVANSPTQDIIEYAKYPLLSPKQPFPMLSYADRNKRQTQSLSNAYDARGWADVCQTLDNDCDTIDNGGSDSKSTSDNNDQVDVDLDALAVKNAPRSAYDIQQTNDRDIEKYDDRNDAQQTSGSLEINAGSSDDDDGDTANEEDEEEEEEEEEEGEEPSEDRSTSESTENQSANEADDNESLPIGRPVRRMTTIQGGSARHLVHRDHRMIFWSLCGKEMAPTRWDHAITSDLRRTHFHRFMDREPAVAREQLHSILRYVALAFPSIGYCQGMHCVAKYLLMFSEAPIAGSPSPPPPTSNAQDDQATASLPTVDSPSMGRPRTSSGELLSSSIMLETERAFVLFAQLLEDQSYRLCSLFDRDFAFYRTILDDIDQRVAIVEPVLFAHLQECGLSAVVYAAKWILTIFTFYVDQDFASVTNVWLRFLSQGWDAVIDIAVACVCCVKEHLMNSDAEACLLVLSGTTEATPFGMLEVVFGTQRGQALLRAPTRSAVRLSSPAPAQQSASQTSPRSGSVPDPQREPSPAADAAQTLSAAPTIPPPPAPPPPSDVMTGRHGKPVLKPVSLDVRPQEQAVAELKASPTVRSRLAPSRRHTGELP